MENRSYDQVRVEPYITSLIANGAIFTNSHALMHRSQPNYVVRLSTDWQMLTAELSELRSE